MMRMIRVGGLTSIKWTLEREDVGDVVVWIGDVVALLHSFDHGDESNFYTG